MADDGSGVYLKLAGSVAVTATTIASNPYNQQVDDIANALNNRLNTSGVKPMTGNLQMGNFKLTGLGAGSAATDSANVSQVQSGVVSHATATAGTVDAITVTHAPVMTAWTAGARGRFTASGANTSTTPTLNPDGIGVKTFVRFDGRALVPGDIAGAGHEVEWEYNGTNVVILNPRVMNAYKGAAVASAATTNIWAGDGDFRHITGSTPITSFGTAPQAGAEMDLEFDGAVLLTYNATSLVLPGAANYTTSAGDRVRVRADTTANMHCTIFPASGKAVVNGITVATVKNSTSGTNLDFTGIPANVNRITVTFSQVSTSGINNYLIQFGVSGIVTTGYFSGFWISGGASGSATNGFVIPNKGAAASLQGTYTFTRMSASAWAGAGAIVDTTTPAGFPLSSGSVQSLAGSPDTIRITTVGGTDTFDAGIVGLAYE